MKRRLVVAVAFAVALFNPTIVRAAPSTDVVRQLIRQLRDDVSEMRECRPTHGLPVDVRELDLAGDGQPAYLLTSIAACECGPVNCSQWIYRRTPQGFAKILEADGYRLSLGATRHHGLADIETEARGSAVSIDRQRYAFDGTTYRAGANAIEDVRTGATKPGLRRVRFAKGRSAALLTGRASFGFTDRWVFEARAGQTLHLALLPGDAGAVLTLVPATDRSGVSIDRVKRWDGVLPSTGDYTVLVDAEGDRPADYRLQLGIDATH